MICLLLSAFFRPVFFLLLCFFVVSCFYSIHVFSGYCINCCLYKKRLLYTRFCYVFFFVKNFWKLLFAIKTWVTVQSGQVYSLSDMHKMQHIQIAAKDLQCSSDQIVEKIISKPTRTKTNNFQRHHKDYTKCI